MATAVDHGAEMVRLARQVNPGAVSRRRLHIAQPDAQALPFAGGLFTCAAMTGVLGFLEQGRRRVAHAWGRV
jgi:hypothetical protein